MLDLLAVAVPVVVTFRAGVLVLVAHFALLPAGASAASHRFPRLSPGNEVEVGAAPPIAAGVACRGTIDFMGVGS